MFLLLKSLTDLNIGNELSLADDEKFFLVFPKEKKKTDFGCLLIIMSLKKKENFLERLDIIFKAELKIPEVKTTLETTDLELCFLEGKPHFLKVCFYLNNAEQIFLLSKYLIDRKR